MTFCVSCCAELAVAENFVRRAVASQNNWPAHENPRQGATSATTPRNSNPGANPSVPLYGSLPMKEYDVRTSDYVLRPPAPRRTLISEMKRLPPIDGATPTTLEPTAKYGDIPAGLSLPDEDVIADEMSARQGLPPGMRRKGFFQSAAFGGSWLVRGPGRDALGISASSVRADFIVPSLLPQSFLTLAPEFRVNRFDDPGTYELPADVYDAAVNFGIRGRLTPECAYQFNVSVGSHSDFDNNDSSQVRVRGYGTGKWTWTPNWDLMVGIAYTDLEDWPLLPVGGLIVRPSEIEVLELTFPRMSYARRIGIHDGLGRHTEYWGLVGIELTGGRWSVHMNDDSVDELTYRDWRFVFGLQQRTLNAWDLNFEIGYVFARRIEYDDTNISYAPDDTFSMTLTGRF
jgi:hypothetical protein